MGLLVGLSILKFRRKRALERIMLRCVVYFSLVSSFLASLLVTSLVFAGDLQLGLPPLPGEAAPAKATQEAGPTGVAESSPLLEMEKAMPKAKSGGRLGAKAAVKSAGKSGVKSGAKSEKTVEEKAVGPLDSGFRASFRVVGAFAVGLEQEAPFGTPPMNGSTDSKPSKPAKANSEWKKLILFDTGSDTQSPKIMLKRKVGEPLGPHYTPYVVLKGKLQKKYKSVLYNNVAVVSDPQDRFSIEVELTSAQQDVALRTVLDNGRVQEVRAEVTTSTWAEVVRTQAEGPPSRLFFGIDTQGTVANYSQTGVIPIQQVALTGKFSASYVLFPSVLDVGFSGYYTVAPLVVQPPTRSIRFLGLNFRAGYQLPIQSARWTFKLMGGYYYATSFPASSDYGFQNAGGPQLFPTVSFRVGTSTVLSTYFKFSPVSSGFSLLSLSSYELATGLGVSLPLKILRPSDGLFIGFDYSVLQLTLSQGVFFLSTYNLGVGYRIGF